MTPEDQLNETPRTSGDGLQSPVEDATNSVKPVQSGGTPTQPFNSTPPSVPTPPAQPSQQFSAPSTPEAPPTSFSDAPTPASGWQPAPFEPQKGNSKKVMKLIIGLVILVVVVAGGFLGYKTLKDKNDSKAVNKALNSSNDDKTDGATEITALNGVTFTMPASALVDYTPTTSANPNAKQYFSKDGNCFVVYGTATPDLLPGKDIGEIVNAYLDRIREAGATVHDPVAAEARVLTGSDGKKYSIPSLNFKFSQGQQHAIGYYSGAVLKSGTRVIVDTSCKNDKGEVDSALMAKAEETIKKLTIKVE